jgi:hypothetical protein
MESQKFKNVSKMNSKKFWILPGTIFAFAKTNGKNTAKPIASKIIQKPVLVTVMPPISNAACAATDISSIDFAKFSLPQKNAPSCRVQFKSTPFTPQSQQYVCELRQFEYCAMQDEPQNYHPPASSASCAFGKHKKQGFNP